jgi:hypothetical protein
MNCTLTSSNAPTSPYAGFAETLTMSIALAPPVVVRQLKAERLTRAAPAAAALSFLLPAISSSLTPCNPGKIHHTSIIIINIKGNETGKIIKSKKVGNTSIPTSKLNGEVITLLHKQIRQTLIMHNSNTRSQMTQQQTPQEED